MNFLFLFLGALMALSAPVLAAAPEPLCAKLQNEQTYETEKSLRGYRFLTAGTDGWVFRTSSDTKEDFKIDRYGLKKLQDFQTALRSRGTELVIAIVPSRGLVAETHIDRTNPWTKNYNAKTALANYHKLLHDMNSADIPATGVVEFSPYLDTFFYKRDQHWTATGARATAGNVAALIQTLPVYQNVRKQLFETRAGKIRPYTGTYAERIADLCGAKFEPETATEYQTTLKSNTIEGSSDLFGDAPLPDIVLVGTSNSTPTPSYANFDGALKQALNADVYNAAVSGGGFDTAMLAYLTSDMFKKNPPKILIWEYPVYYTLTKSSEAGRQLNEFVAAAFGPCTDKKLTTQSVNKLIFQETTLLSNLNAHPGIDQSAYLVLNFESPVYKKFKIDLFYENGETRHYTFQRSRTAENDGSFYLMLQPQDSPLNRIETRVHKEMVGLRVKAAVCQTPLELEPFKAVETSESDEIPENDTGDKDRDQEDEKK